MTETKKDFIDLSQFNKNELIFLIEDGINKLIKKGGFTLIDAFENEHKIGQKEFSEKII